MLACELALLMRDSGAGFALSTYFGAPLPALLQDAGAGHPSGASGVAEGGSGGAGPGPQPCRGLCGLVRDLGVLSPGPIYLLLAATSPLGLATAESTRRHGELSAAPRAHFFSRIAHTTGRLVNSSAGCTSAWLIYALCVLTSIYCRLWCTKKN